MVGIDKTGTNKSSTKNKLIIITKIVIYKQNRNKLGTFKLKRKKKTYFNIFILMLIKILWS